MGLVDISIIVPVYNSEKYISICIESILNQSFKNFEVLIINDGSLDKSAEICEKYSSVDNRIRIFHQTNSGVSIARNKGIENAKGKYICFIDSDDWIEPSYLYDFETFLNLPKGTIFIQGYKDSYNGKQYVNKDRSYTKDYYSSDLPYAIEFSKLFHSGYPFCKLYEREILIEKEIRYIENINLFEDSLFNYDYFKHIKAIKVSSKSGYIYEHRSNNSLSRKYLSYLERETILKLFFYKSTDLFDLYSLGNSYKKEVNKITLVLLTQTIYSLYRPNFKENKESRVEKIKYLYENYSNLFEIIDYRNLTNFVIKLKKPSFTDRYLNFLFICRYSFPFLYKLYINIINTIRL